MRIQASGTITKVTVDGEKGQLVITDKDDRLYAFEFYKKAELIQNLKEGTSVEVTAFINTREWNNKYFVNLNGTEVKVVGDVLKNARPAEDNNKEDELDDSLPF